MADLSAGTVPTHEAPSCNLLGGQPAGIVPIPVPGTTTTGSAVVAGTAGVAGTTGVAVTETAVGAGVGATTTGTTGALVGAGTTRTGVLALGVINEVQRGLWMVLLLHKYRFS